MKAGKLSAVDTAGLSAAGIWVRRLRQASTVADEALSIAHVLQLWDLSDAMDLSHYDATYAEVSGPDLHPTWVFLVELIGRRIDDRFFFSNHPLSQVGVGEEARIVAIVQPPDFFIPGALVETESHRRMIWLQPVPAGDSP